MSKGDPASTALIAISICDFLTGFSDSDMLISMKKKFKLQRVGSVFTPIFLSFLLMAMISMLLHSYFSSRLVAENQRDRITIVNLNELEQTSSFIDACLLSVTKSAMASMRSSDIMSLLINPDSGDRAQNFRVIQRLKNIAIETDLIRDVALYIPFSQLVYTMNDQILPATSYLNWPVLQQHVKQMEDIPVFYDEDCHTWIRLSAGRVYIMTNMRTATLIGVLAIELNVEELNRYLTDSLGMENHTYLFNEKNLPMLSAVIECPFLDELDFSGGTLWITGTEEKPAAGRYYYYQSETTGLQYVRRYDNDPMTVPAALWLRTLMPTGAIYLVVGLLFTLYIHRKVYQPFNRLMNLASPGGHKTGGTGLRNQNEIDYLTVNYEELKEENSQANQLLRSISQDVQEQLLCGLILGRHTQEDYLNATLEGIHAPLTGCSRFQVLAGEWTAQSPTPEFPVEYVYPHSIRNVVTACNADCTATVFLVPEPHIWVLVLGFDKGISLLTAATAVSRLEQELQNSLAVLPITCWIGAGKPCSSLMDITYSYKEALTQMRYRRYRGVEGESAPTAQAFACDFSQHVQRICGEIEEKQMEQAQAMFQRVLEEADAYTDPAEAYRQVAEDISRKLIQYHISFESQHLQRILLSREHQESTQELRRCVECFGEESWQRIAANHKKRHHRYIETAKEYIGGHFEDSSLSLMQVSEHVGISAPYLSKLFAEYVGESFSEYLNLQRVSLAKQLLEKTKLSAEEIGYQCGFNSRQSFNRVFKKHTGGTPGQYRDRTRG